MCAACVHTHVHEWACVQGACMIVCVCARACIFMGLWMYVECALTQLYECASPHEDVRDRCVSVPAVLTRM